MRFKELPPEEKAKLIARNPAYGRVICRCETITEGEILDALHTEIPATTIDGVKRRCNAGWAAVRADSAGPGAGAHQPDAGHRPAGRPAGQGRQQRLTVRNQAGGNQP